VNTELQGILRALVASLWARRRPPQDLTPEERKGLTAERADFQNTIIDLLRSLDVDNAVIAQHARDVFRDREAQPAYMALPTPDELANAIIRRCQRVVGSAPCVACEALGSSPGIFGTSDLFKKRPGDGPMLPRRQDERLCVPHYEVYTWYVNRNRAYLDNRVWAYEPPLSMLPAGAHKDFARDVDWRPWTDGAHMTDHVRWIRAYVEQSFAWTLLEGPGSGVQGDLAL